MTSPVEVLMRLSSSFRSVQADMTEEFEIHGPVKGFKLISSFTNQADLKYQKNQLHHMS